MVSSVPALAAVDTASLRKARGAFFTPQALCELVAAWAVRTPVDTVFEPSCGEAAFLLAAGDRLRALGGTVQAGQLRGVDLHEGSVVSARSLLEEDGLPSEITTGDFFDLPLKPAATVVLGNPPYVRYQDFSGNARAKSRQAALLQGVRLTGLASSWASFTVHAAQFVAPGGRMGLVLPAELLTVNYASQVRDFLLRRFGKVRLVLFEERVFPGVLEEVVLLLAEGEGPVDHFELHQAKDLAELAELGSTFNVWRPSEGAGKWLSALLEADAAEVYRTVTASEHMEMLDDWGDTSLGMVSGNNKYFALSREDVERHGLAMDDLIKISPPGSRHLRGLNFTTAAWDDMVKEGARAYLFRPGFDPSDAALKYIQLGVDIGVHNAYKCRVRKPWWMVPLVPAPHLLLTYMNHDTPRLVRNEAGVRCLNSVHGVRLRKGRIEAGQELLPLAVLNSATLLGAEVVGRSYGGGLLKLEPKEADVLPVPSLSLVKQAEVDLRAIRPQLAKHFRSADLNGAVQLVDDILLVRHGGLSRKQVKSLRSAREDLFARRRARGGTRGQG